jgi:hypothetical protein
VPLLKGGRRPTRDDLLPFEERTRTFNQFVITAGYQYGQAGASRMKTNAEVQAYLKTSTALDPDVMGVIYADYDAPSPRESEPTRVSRRIAAASAA